MTVPTVETLTEYKVGPSATTTSTGLDEAYAKLPATFSAQSRQRDGVTHVFDRNVFEGDLLRATASDRATREIEANPEEVAELRAARERMARGEVRWVPEGQSVLDAHTD